MDITLDSIIGILSLLLGGGMGGFFTWRYQRAKAKWEAKEKQTYDGCGCNVRQLFQHNILS